MSGCCTPNAPKGVAEVGLYDDPREAVRQDYGKTAQGEASCCAGMNSTELGYDPAELANLPEGADLGLGCGNPQELAKLNRGEWVLDLGSGAGIDCFLAAKRVGPEGRVIGVDMTPEMLAKARSNLKRSGMNNVEFRLGEIEALPVGDAQVDVILSNCVVNLSPEKGRVFAEAFRVLKPGGRLALSDICSRGELPKELKESREMVSACIGGAAPIEEIRALLEQVGFEQIELEPLEGSEAMVQSWTPEIDLQGRLVSVAIAARKAASRP